MLVKQADDTGVAILGKPSEVLSADSKFQSNAANHIYAGEMLAHSSLASECLVCDVLGLKYRNYIG